MSDERTVAGHLWDYAQQHERYQLAAAQLASYLRELLSDAGIDTFTVEARAKSLLSYRVKSEKTDAAGSPKYGRPAQEIEDCIAARIIVFTKRARSQAVKLLEQTCSVRAPGAVNPGHDKHNGYDSDHLIITAFQDEEVGRRARDLHWFLTVRPGLEVQVRTVAGHAWAEYEHDVRYKTPSDEGQDAVTSGYDALPADQQLLIDQLFVEAGGLRKYLDATFDHIEQVLRPDITNQASNAQPEPDDDLIVIDTPTVALHDSSLLSYLTGRYPDHDLGSERSREFVLECAHRLGLSTVEALDAALQDVDTKRVASLMPYENQPTAVRRLEDDLLARFEEQLIEAALQISPERGALLEGRLRRLRGKLLIYTVIGVDRLEGRFMTAARTFRELVRYVSEKQSPQEATIPGLVSLRDDLDSGARARQIRTPQGPIWVNSNLSRSAAEVGMVTLLGRLQGTGIRLLRAGDELAASQ
jgi:ppGpp synthetase/RelA/SpoT-type nucleotidyltranferase